MRQRMRKKMVERQSLFNIHLAQFTAELNRTVEDAYRTLDAVLAEVDGPAEDAALQDQDPEQQTARPPDPA